MRKNTDLSLGKTIKGTVTLERNYPDLKQREISVSKETDSAIVEKQLSLIRAMAQLSSSGVTVFDLHKQAHIYTSRNFYQLFGYEIQDMTHVESHVFDRKVHPDDLKQLAINGFAAMKFLSEVPPQQRKQYKMINEYRISPVAGKYIQVIEQHQVLEQDSSGNVWLSLGVIDVSPNQSPRDGVKFQIINFVTGEFVQLQTNTPNSGAHLTSREKEILNLIRDGKLSKEISYLLEISIHTVNTHRQRILEKLNVNNSIEAVYTAKELGLIV